MTALSQNACADEYPFDGILINGVEAAIWIKNGLALCQEQVSICSAFVRSEALLEMLPPAANQPSARVLVRWRLDDLLSGASDLDVYKVVRSAGWEMYMRLDFHGKVYAVPGEGVLVGSANATSKGLGFSHSPNLEVCTLVPDSRRNLQITDSFFSGATLVDADLFLAIRDSVANCERASMKTGEWPDTVMERLMPFSPPAYLLVSECLFSDPNWLLDGGRAPSSAEAIHDLELLSVPSDQEIDLRLLRARFRTIAIYKWLMTAVAQCQGEAYFGKLSSRLHSTLADSPAPCRRDVKILLHTLLEWVAVLKLEEVTVERPNYSQRVRITG